MADSARIAACGAIRRSTGAVTPRSDDTAKPARCGLRCFNLAAMTVATGDAGGTEGGPCPCGPCRERAQKLPVRAGRWIVRHSDLTKPTATLIRWLGILLVGIVYVAIGAPAALGDWLWFAILGGILILPDVAGFGVAGVRLDLKQTQDELNAVKLRIDMRQQVNNYNYYPALERATEAQTGEDAPKQRRVVEVPMAEGEGGDVPLWP